MQDPCGPSVARTPHGTPGGFVRWRPGPGTAVRVRAAGKPDVSRMLTEPTAVEAFALCDAAGLRIRLPSVPHDARGYELRLAVASTLIGLADLAIAISGPIYASATSTIEPEK